MARTLLYSGLAGATLIGIAFWWNASRHNSADSVFEPSIQSVEAAPLCPWREPNRDLRAFFPDATGYQREIRILSGKRLELQRRLGRAPNAEENALYVYRVLQGIHPLGAILTRRVKGENGAIELVLAVNSDQTVSGLRLQRLREPASTAQALEDPAWLGAFRGKSVDGPWLLGKGIPALPACAQPSGQAIIDGVRSLLVSLAVAPDQSSVAHHH